MKLLNHYGLVLFLGGGVDKFDRIYALHKILSASRHPVSRSRLEADLECKRATIGRIIVLMKDSLGAPIEYDPVANGYFYNRKKGEHPYELPGLWFNAGELLALITLSQLIHDLQPGLLEEQLRLFQKRIEQLLASKQLGNGELSKRIRVLSVGTRRNNSHGFKKVAEAVLQRNQIKFHYHARNSDQVTSRTVSPQRLIRYRDNWYLDGYCHLRNELRSFALERISQLTLLEKKAREIGEEALDKHFADAYGIFSGASDEIAVLHFTPKAARWVSEESWHPRQEGKFLDNGSYQLCIPYRHDQELVMDILKYGSDVEVKSPEALRHTVKAKLAMALKQYEG